LKILRTVLGKNRHGPAHAKLNHVAIQEVRRPVDVESLDYLPGMPASIPMLPEVPPCSTKAFVNVLFDLLNKRESIHFDFARFAY
jgi:hypothetical protein